MKKGKNKAAEPAVFRYRDHMGEWREHEVAPGETLIVEFDVVLPTDGALNAAVDVSGALHVVLTLERVR